MKLPAASQLDFDIDHYLNRFVPPSQLHRLPKCVSWWLGYRETPGRGVGSIVVWWLGYRETPGRGVGSIVVWWWSFLGAFCGILCAGAVYRYGPGVENHELPVIFASLGASAILEYNTIQSPLAQPRNSIIGHSLSAIVGVAIAKLFMLRHDYDEIRWVAGAVCCGVASAVMGMTNTIHPPGGATALLAAVDPTTIRLGWTFIPMIMVGTLIITAVACIVNNIQRQFPVYWWTPKDCGWGKKPEDVESVPVKDSMAAVHIESKNLIAIDGDRVVIPPGFALAWEEERILHILRDRLRDQEHGDALRQHSLPHSDKTACEEDSSSDEPPS